MPGLDNGARLNRGRRWELSLGEHGRGLRVLVIEDCETDGKLVIQQLRASGFSPEWERVETPEGLRAALRTRSWQLVISDSSVPRLGALEALTMTKALAPDVPFIVVSGTIQEDLVVEVIRKGAADYVSKDHLERLAPAVARELLAARERAPSSTDALLAGDAERWRRARALLDELGRIHEELKQTLESAAVRRGTARARALAEARGLVDEALARTREVRVEPPTRSRHTAAPSSGGARVDVLTPRQREVLQRVVLGQSTRAIAEQLAISVKTVETHRAQIMERLDIHNVAALVLFAVRSGIVPPRA